MSSDDTIKRLKAGKVECIVTFSKEEVVPAEKQAMELLGKDIKIPGFRPGKAPAEMLGEKIDPEKLFEQTIHQLLPAAMEKLIKEENIQPIMSPKIEAESRDPLTLKITFIEKPPVKFKGIDKIKIEKKEPKVDEKEIQKMVDYILEKHQTKNEVDRAAKEGDEITMDFFGTDEEEKEIEGIRTTGHQVVIGSKVLLPGFEDELKGMKKGEKKEFTLTFPEKYHAEHLQNKPVTFHVTVTKIDEVSKPELTDAFAKKELNANDVADFKNQIEESMKGQEQQFEDQRRERALMDKIREATKVELAQELVEEEARIILQELEQQLSKQKITMENWMQQQNKEPKEIQKDLMKQGEDRLTLRIGMQQLVEEKEIDINEEKMKQIVEEFLMPAPAEQRKELEAAYQKGQKAYEQLKWQKKVEQVIAEMLSI